MEEEPGILQSALGKIIDFILWLKEKMEDEKVRRDVLLDLGLDPDTDVELQIPEESVDNINEYRQSINPDNVAFKSALNDVKIVFNSIKEFITAFIDDPGDVDTYVWLFLEVNSTNYIRLHFPLFYWTSQVLGFIVESKVTFQSAFEDQGLPETLVMEGPKVIVKNIWDLFTDPLDYFKNIWHKITEPRGDQGHLETIESAEHLSQLMTVLAGLFTVFESKLPESRYLFGWTTLPRTMEKGSTAELIDTFLGNLLLDTIRKEIDPSFPQNTDAAWDKIETVIAKDGNRSEDDPPLPEVELKVLTEYRTTVHRWERGDWVDLVSERAFSFDLKFPSDDESNFDNRLGGTMIFISDEEVSEYFNKDAQVKIESLGGLFISLNGEVNYKNEISENWEFELKTSSGDLLDIYASRMPHVSVVGDINLGMSIKRKVNSEFGSSFDFPDKSGTRLRVGEFQFKAFLSKDDGGFEISLKDNAVVISHGDGDSFLREVLPSGDVPLPFSVSAGLTRKKGFYMDHDIDTLQDVLDYLKDEDNEANPSFAANPSDFEIEKEADENSEAEKNPYQLLIPIHKDLDLLYFDQVKWDYGAITREDALGGYLKVLTTFSSKMGPVLVKVENTGLGVEALAPNQEGELGTVDFSFGFTPPRGVALALNTELISGGGFLELDFDNHRYAGIMTFSLDLISREIGMTAVGLINTRLPNAEKGFSMLISVGVFFDPPFRLPYNFTLNAVGGLVGIRRTMKVDILRDRIQNGSIHSIMFPENVIKNSSKIISDLRAVFPPQKKHHVAALFFRIGYGTPTILEVDLGMLIEIPFKGRLILLGSLGVYLPTREADKRLGEIHVDVFGDFNFSGGYILIEGRLRDSHLVEVVLTGGFAFVLDWSNQPQFLLSVGGYHPRYKKPARFPDIPRVTALIKKGDDIRLSCEYYQAFTSNSFQIGLTAELVVKKGHARAYGFVGFNALLQFDPLFFEVDIRISVEVSYRGRSFFGVDLEFLLSGPEPWLAKGYAKIKVLFFSLKVRFNISWGEEQEVTALIIQPDELMEKLEAQLLQSGNWTMKTRAGSSESVALKNLEEMEDQDQVFMAPFGYLELRQNLIPLNKTLEKVGHSYLSTGTRYEITNFAFGSGEQVALQSQNLVQDYFSRGHFEDLTDSEKLSTPDFDLMTAGMQIIPDQVYDIPDREDDLQWVTNDFEDIVIEETGITRRKGSSNWQGNTLINNISDRKLKDESRPEVLYGVVEEMPDYPGKSYKILSKEDLDSPEILHARYFNSYSGAKEFLHINWPEEKRGKWQILQAETQEEEEVLIM